MKKIMDKPVEIFCGTGGVGKTTLATSRALQLALDGKRVLLITIDPARRLKQLIGLKEKDTGKVKSVPANLFTENKRDQNITFHALLMTPFETFSFIKSFHGITINTHNPILNILMRPYGGMNEIMSIVELHRHLDSKLYDCIILDTPPGNNFIDFLEASEKINTFFEKSFIDVFQYISTQKQSPSFSFFSNVVSSSINKLLSYLEKVTGKIFVENFIDTIESLYNLKKTFLDAIKIQQILKSSSMCNWFLVTSVEQLKILQAQNLLGQSKSFIDNNSYLLINKSLTPFLNEWEILPNDDDNLKQLKKTISKKEKLLKDMGKKDFKATYFFPEVIDESPQKHVLELYQHWK